VVYALALDVCYWVRQDKGAFKDGDKLPLKTAEQRKTYNIVVSRSHMSNEKQACIDGLDVALRYSDDDWVGTRPKDISEKIAHPHYYRHLLCNIFIKTTY